MIWFDIIKNYINIFLSIVINLIALQKNVTIFLVNQVFFTKLNV